jgi:hypothetical protein
VRDSLRGIAWRRSAACENPATARARASLRIATFVATLAAVGFGSAAIAFGFQAAFVRGDRGRLRELEERIARLERA